MESVESNTLICRFIPQDCDNDSNNFIHETCHQSSSRSYTTDPIILTLNIFSLLTGLVGLCANCIILTVCANRIMGKRPYSRFVIPVAVCDILFIIAKSFLIVMPMMDLSFYNDLNVVCKIEYYISAVMGMATMASIHLSTGAAYDRLSLLIDPYAVAGLSLLQKCLRSTKIVMLTLTIVVCINLPRFILPNVVDIQLFPMFNGLSYLYEILVDAIIPYIMSSIFAIRLCKKSRTHQAHRIENFPNTPKPKKSNVVGVIVISTINTIAIGFSMVSYFILIIYVSTILFVPSFVAYLVHLSIFVLIVNASIKIFAYYKYGTYFFKAYNDTMSKFKNYFLK